MDKTRDISLGEALQAAGDWWRLAGVDQDFADEPLDWLAKAEVKDTSGSAGAAPVPAATPTPPPEPPIGGDRADWPKAFDTFAEWWLSEPSLALAGGSRRIAPRGASGADLMVLVASPEEGDTEALLSGPHGRLVANMLDAMGIAPDRACIASALPAHARHPDWAMLARRDYGEIVRHMISLAAPRRLLVLSHEILPLLGHDPAQGAAVPRQFALEGTGIEALATVDVESLLHERRFRAALWRAWLDWRDDPA